MRARNSHVSPNAHVLALILCLAFVATIGAREATEVEVESALSSPVKFSVSLKNFSGPSATVQVKIENSNPSKTDLIGLFAAGADLATTMALKELNLSSVGGYMQKKMVSFNVVLLNARVDYQFYLYREPLRLLDEPNHILVFLAKDAQNRTRDDALNIRWNARLCTGHAVVQYGSSATNLDRSASAVCSTYTREDMCNDPASTSGWFEPGYVFVATITGLVPGQTYFYSFGDPSAPMSKIYNVRAPFPVGDRSRTTRVVLFADYGKYNEDIMDEHLAMPDSKPTTDNLIEESTKNDLLFLIGDVAYVFGRLYQWDQFGHQMSRFAGNTTLMTAIGNHEIVSSNVGANGALFNGPDSGGECGVPYQTRFPMPGTARGKPWHSFDSGLIHFTVMSSEHDWSPSSEQYEFLARDLATVNRTATPWLIFAGHRPMYIDSKKGKGDPAVWPPIDSDQGVAQMLQKYLEPLLIKFNVDLAVWGHHHSYQRTCKVAFGNCSKSHGIPHLCIGNAGAGFTLGTFIFPRPDIFEVAEFIHGYSRVQATPTTFTFESINNAGRLVFDSFTLHKN